MLVEHQGRIGLHPDPVAVLVFGPVSRRLREPGDPLLDQPEDALHHSREVLGVDHGLGVLESHLVGVVAKHPDR